MQERTSKGKIIVHKFVETIWKHIQFGEIELWHLRHCTVLTAHLALRLKKQQYPRYCEQQSEKDDGDDNIGRRFFHFRIGNR